MAVTACIPTQAKADFLAGVHLAADTYKCALHDQGTSTFDATTPTWSATGEVGNSGTYVSGGFTMTGYTSGTSGTSGYIDWTTDPNWTSATITADCAVIYNTTRANKIVAILTFASTTSTAGTWTLQLPAAGATAVIKAA